MNQEIAREIENIESRLQTTHDPERRLLLLLQLCRLLVPHNSARALELLAEGLRLANGLNRGRLIADVLYYQGIANHDLCNMEQARQIMRIAYDHFTGLRCSHMAALAAFRLGGMEEKCGETRNALRWYHDGLEQANAHGFRETPDGDDEIEKEEDIRVTTAKILEALGRIYTDIGDYTRALDYHFRCLALRDEFDDARGKGLTFSAIGLVYGLTGDYDAAYGYFMKSLGAFRECGDRFREVQTLTNLASVYYSKDELDTALEYALKALTIYELLRDKVNSAATLVTIGNIHEKISQPDSALQYQLRALDTIDGLPEENLRIAILQNIARLYRETGEHIGAQFIFEQALSIAQEIGDRYMQYQLHEALSRTHEQLGDLRKALEHHENYARIRFELAGMEKQKEIALLQVRFDIEKAERERENYRLRVEKLEAEVKQKQTELTVMALNLVEKMELFEALKKRLSSASERGEDGGVREIIQELDASVTPEDNWKAFEKQLNNTYPDFIRTLSERFPSLAPMELKICCLIKINLANKDIATLLFISHRTVETHRYNIRRKLNLRGGTSLGGFLAGL